MQNSELIVQESAQERAIVIAGEINAIKDQVMRAALSGACEIGRRLIEVKGYIRHGSFGAWLRENVDYTDRDAQRMMQLYEKYGKNPIAGAENLSISQAVALIAAPEEVRRELIESGDAQDMSVRELRAEVERERRAREEQQLTLDELTDKLNAQQQESRRLQETAEDAVARANERSAEYKKVAAENESLHKQLAGEVKRASEAEQRAAEAEQREPKVVTERVEVVPEEVQQELASLRKLAANAQRETILARDCYARLTETYNSLIALAEQMPEGERMKYAPAFAKAMRAMAERMEGLCG